MSYYAFTYCIKKIVIVVVYEFIFLLLFVAAVATYLDMNVKLCNFWSALVCLLFPVYTCSLYIGECVSTLKEISGISSVLGGAFLFHSFIKHSFYKNSVLELRDRKSVV